MVAGRELGIRDVGIRDVGIRELGIRHPSSASESSASESSTSEVSETTAAPLDPCEPMGTLMPGDYLVNDRCVGLEDAWAEALVRGCLGRGMSERAG